MNADADRGVRLYAQEGRRPRLSFSGTVDIFFAEELHALGKQLLTMTGDLEVDCAAADHLDTAILQLLLSLQRTMEPHGRQVYLTGTSGRLQECLKLTGLASCLPVRPAPAAGSTHVAAEVPEPEGLR